MNRFTTTLSAVLLGTLAGGTAAGDALSLLQDEAAAPGGGGEHAQGIKSCLDCCNELAVRIYREDIFCKPNIEN